MSTDINETAPELKKLNLTIDVDKVSACRRHVRVSIPREDIDRYFRERFEQIMPEAAVPGFRQGKAPRALVESRFKKQVADQVRGSLLMDSLSQVNESDAFSAISEPELDYEKISLPETGDFKFEFDIEVRPDFKTPEWKGIRLEQPEREFSDKDIENYIMMLGSANATLVPVDEPAVMGDTLVCEIRSSLDGEVVNHEAELPVRVREILSLGDAEILDFGSQMAGVKGGESRTFDVQVSEFSDNEKFRGKSLKVEFNVLDVKRQESPDRAGMAEKFGFSSEGDFVDFIKSQLGSQLEYEQRQSIRNQISEKLTESAEWELPPELLKRQFKRELQRALMELRRSGFSNEEVRNHENRLRQDAMRRTETLLKEHFILERIAEEEKVEDAPEDYDAEIDRIARSSNESPRRVRSRMEKNGQIDMLRNMIIEGKVIDMIKQHAEFTTVPAKSGVSRDKIESLDFSISGMGDGEIPDAKYDEQPAKPLPGSVVPGTASKD